jgi:hypothetical protein
MRLVLNLFLEIKQVRREIGEERVGGHILTFTDGFTDGISVGETVDDSDGTIDTSPHGSAISNPSAI